MSGKSSTIRGRHTKWMNRKWNALHEVVVLFKQEIKKRLPHVFKIEWMNATRAFDINNVGPNIIVLLTDFAATLDLKAIETVNCSAWEFEERYQELTFIIAWIDNCPNQYKCRKKIAGSIINTEKVLGVLVAHCFAVKDNFKGVWMFLKNICGGRSRNKQGRQTPLHFHPLAWCRH